MEPVRPNAYLRCESRRPRLGLAGSLWKYSLALVIVASAAIDALWLVPAAEEDVGSQAPDASAYHDALHHRCRISGRVEAAAPTPADP
jgi:hypothetical protein